MGSREPRVASREYWLPLWEHLLVLRASVSNFVNASVGGGHTGQVGDHTTCSQNKHVGKFLYFKLPKLPLQVKSRAIKDVTK